MSDVKVVENKLTKKELNRSWFTWFKYYLCVFGFERLEAPGFLLSMMPIADHFYKGDEEKKKALLKRHAVFFNTEVGFGSVIPGIVLSLEEAKANGADISDDFINNIKVGLMGPLAGIGDSINQATMTPILLSICIGLSAEGAASGVLLFVLFNMAYFIIVSRILFFKGYNLGESVVDNLLGKKMTLIQNSLTVAGLTVTGAITANYVKFNITAQYVSEYKTVVIQEVLDGLFPKLIPVLLVFLGYWLISKKRFSALKVMLIYVLIATVGVLIRLL